MEKTIFIHGNPGSPLIYKDLMLGLSEPVLVSLPGLGFSNFPPPSGLEDIFRNVEAQVSPIMHEYSEINLVGHDWGVPVCIFIASQWSSKVKRFIFFNTAIGDFSKLPRWLSYFGKSKISSLLFLLIAALNSTSFNQIIKPYLGKRVFNISRYISLVPIKELNSFISNIYVTAKAKGVFEIPTLIIWGLRDPCLSLDHLVDLKCKFSKSYVYLSGAGHFVPLDMSDTCKKEFKSFLSHAETPKQSNLMNLFDENVRRLKSLPALIETNGLYYHKLTFKELDVQVYRVQKELRRLSLKKRFIFLALKPWRLFVPAFLACIREGVIPILIDPKIELKNFVSALKSISDLRTLGNFRTWFLLNLFPLAGVKLKNYLYVFDKILGRKNESQLPESLDDILFIAFTSGGTGIPKPVVYTQSMLYSQLEIFRTRLNMNNYGIDFPVTPAFFIFNLFLGRASLFIDGVDAVSRYNFENVVKNMSVCQVSHVFGSKYFWLKLIDSSICQDVNLNFINMGIISGAPLYRSFVKKILDRAEFKIVGAYGSTEALPVSFYSLHDSLNPGLGLYVGTPLIDFFLDDTGEILVNGENISSKYLNNHLNQKFKTNINGRIFHRMGDVGALKDKDLYILGRKTDCVLNENYYPYPLEDFLITRLNLSDCATILKDGKVYVFVQDTVEESVVKRLVYEFCQKETEVIKLPALPYDLRHNSKILRWKLHNLIK